MLADSRLGKPFLDKKASFKSRNHRISLRMRSTVELNIKVFSSMFNEL